MHLMLSNTACLPKNWVTHMSESACILSRMTWGGVGKECLEGKHERETATKGTTTHVIGAERKRFHAMKSP